MSRVRITRAKRSASSAARARSLPPTNAAMSFLDRLLRRRAPCRPPPQPERLRARRFADMGRFRPCSSVRRAGNWRGERAATAPERLIFTALFTPRPRQKASNSSSNRASSVRREANRAPHRGAQAFGPLGHRARHQPRRVLRFGLANDEACVAQGDDKPGKRVRIAGPGSGPSIAKALRAPITRPCPRAGLSSPC